MLSRRAEVVDPGPAALGAADGRLPPGAGRPGALLLRARRRLGGTAVAATSTWPAAPSSTSAAGPATSATPSVPPARRTGRWTRTSASSPGWATSPAGTVIGDGMNLPFRDDSVDLCYSSNVLEHVPRPWDMADEMLRVTRPGGIAFISYTVWYGPWGGHETAPWHYLGGARARRRYAPQARARAEEQVRRVALRRHRPRRRSPGRAGSGPARCSACCRATTRAGATG